MTAKRNCLHCEDGNELAHEQRDLVFSYRDHKMVVPAVAGWHCRTCGECEFDPGEAARYSVAIDAFSAEVDREIAATVRAIRKRLGLKQAEAGRLFGGGINAFSEYERGRTHPHRSTLLLLKLLDRHPELLGELVS